MDYWDEVMQDDIYLISTAGWLEAAKPRQPTQDKKVKETPDLTIGKKKYIMDLIPPIYVAARYFPQEQANINNTLQTAQETATQTLDEYIEEHTTEDGLLTEATNNSGNITKTNVNARLKELEKDDEYDALKHCLSLIDAKAKADRALKDAQLALDKQVLTRYNTLTETEIKQLVIDDKWLATIQTAITDEVQRLTQNLTERIKELEERYAQPLPDLENEIENFSQKVSAHLLKMGVPSHE